MLFIAPFQRQQVSFSSKRTINPLLTVACSGSMPVEIQMPVTAFCLVLFPNNLLYLQRKQTAHRLRTPDYASEGRTTRPELHAV